MVRVPYLKEATHADDCDPIPNIDPSHPRGRQFNSTGAVDWYADRIVENHVGREINTAALYALVEAGWAQTDFSFAGAAEDPEKRFGDCDAPSSVYWD